MTYLDAKPSPELLERIRKGVHDKPVFQRIPQVPGAKHIGARG